MDEHQHLADLIAAWERWDQKPGAEVTANARLDRLNEVCDALGLSPVVLHARICAERRRGRSPRQAIIYAVRRSSSGSDSSAT